MIQFNRAKGESPKSHTDHKREIKYITRIKYYLKQTMGYFSSLYKSWVWFKLILTSFLKDVSNCYFLYLLFLLKGVIITSNTFESSTFPGTQCLAGSGTLEYLLNKSYIAKLQKKKTLLQYLAPWETLDLTISWCWFSVKPFFTEFALNLELYFEKTWKCL